MVSTFCWALSPLVAASASYSRRNSSRGSPTLPEKRGALGSRADGMPAAPGGLAAMTIGGTTGGAGSTGGGGGGGGTGCATGTTVVTDAIGAVCAVCEVDVVGGTAG